MLSVVLVAVGATATPALAATGDLTQKPGQAGCIRQVDFAFGPPQPDPLCTDATGIDTAHDVEVSPDGRNAYAVGYGSDSVAVFDRNLATGALTQQPQPAACVSENGTGSPWESVFGPPVIRCQNGRLFESATAVAVSPDGKNVYVTSRNGVAILDRNTETGALTQKQGTAGCISQDGTDGEGTAGQCATGRALFAANSVTISPEGSHVYVASQGSNAVVIFDRGSTTGVLTQKPGMAGCISEAGTGGCTDGRALAGAQSVTVSPNGRSVYVQSPDAVAIFDRNRITGALTQKSDAAGCISETGAGAGAGGCAAGRALNSSTPGAVPPPRSVAVSPDGSNVYVASFSSDAVAILDRNTTTGALSQKAGQAGCISESGAGGCAAGRQLGQPSGVAVSPDGENLYVSSYASFPRRDGSAVVIFDRDRVTGAISQKPGTAGCISDDQIEGDTTCRDGHGLSQATSVTVSPHGENVYTSANNVFGFLAIFDREVPPDADNDGVIDPVDRCPNQPGPASNQGCPVAGAGSSGGGNYPLPVTPAAPFADCLTATANIIRGTAASERITGTVRGDRIFAGTGNDVVDALAGNDCVDLGTGADRGQGGLGHDLILGGLGADRIAGSSGNDRLRGEGGNDRINGGFGNDRLHGQAGRDRIAGSRGRDRINGGSANDVILGGSGHDRVAGDQGNDRIYGNSGNDVLRGNSGHDQIKGSTGFDRIAGGSGNDRINSRDGRRDRINCGRGRDRVIADRFDVIARNCEKVVRRR